MRGSSLQTLQDAPYLHSICQPAPTDTPQTTCVDSPLVGRRLRKKMRVANPPAAPSGAPSRCGLSRTDRSSHLDVPPSTWGQMVSELRAAVSGAPAPVPPWGHLHPAPRDRDQRAERQLYPTPGGATPPGSPCTRPWGWGSRRGRSPSPSRPLLSARTTASQPLRGRRCRAGTRPVAVSRNIKRMGLAGAPQRLPQTCSPMSRTSSPLPRTCEEATEALGKGGLLTGPGQRSVNPHPAAKTA